MTKDDIEFAAASIFITDGGQEAVLLNLVNERGELLQQRPLSEVVWLLCHHLGVKE